MKLNEDDRVALNMDFNLVIHSSNVIYGNEINNTISQYRTLSHAPADVLIMLAKQLCLEARRDQNSQFINTRRITEVCRDYRKLFFLGMTVKYLGFNLFWHIWGITSTFQFVQYFLWLRITEEGSIPEIRSMSLIRYDIQVQFHVRLKIMWHMYSINCDETYLTKYIVEVLFCISILGEWHWWCTRGPLEYM